MTMLTATLKLQSLVTDAVLATGPEAPSTVPLTQGGAVPAAAAGPARPTVPAVSARPATAPEIKRVWNSNVFPLLWHL